MSRLIELVLEHEDDLTVHRLPVVAKRLLSHLDADAGGIRVAFPLVCDLPAPVTRLHAANVHDAALSVRCHGENVELSVEVEVVATSLCPCSKAISDYGAHNQRSRIKVSVLAYGGDAETRLPALDQLVAWAEAAASCPAYPLLKRSDERYVTERAYDKPAFVEDIVRDLALQLQGLEGPGEYSVRVVNEESIHRHDAFASVNGTLQEPARPALAAQR